MTQREIGALAVGSRVRAGGTTGTITESSWTTVKIEWDDDLRAPTTADRDGEFLREFVELIG